MLRCDPNVYTSCSDHTPNTSATRPLVVGRACSTRGVFAGSARPSVHPHSEASLPRAPQQYTLQGSHPVTSVLHMASRPSQKMHKNGSSYRYA